MFSEYAVDPDLLDDFSNLTFIRESFSPITGRLIADPFRDWKNNAKSKIIHAINHSSFRPKEKYKAKRELEKLINSRGFCLRPQEIVENTQAQPWLENIYINNERYPFSAIISNARHEQAYRPSEFILKEPANWRLHEENTWLVSRDASSLVEAMMPLLKISSDVKLIDPYLDIAKSAYANVLKEIIRRQSEFNFAQGVTCIEVYTQEENFKPDDLNVDWIPKGFLKAKTFHKKRIHDRFLLTEHGCLQFGHGFAEDEKSLKVNIYRVSKEKVRKMKTCLDNPNLRNRD